MGAGAAVLLPSCNRLFARGVGPGAPKGVGPVIAPGVGIGVSNCLANVGVPNLLIGVD